MTSSDGSTTSSSTTSASSDLQKLLQNQQTGDVDLVAIEAKLLAIADETDALRKVSDRNHNFQQSIYDHRLQSRDQVRQLQEKLTEMKGGQKNFDKKWQDLADERVRDVLQATEQYTRTGQTPTADQIDTLNVCIELHASLAGLTAMLEKTRAVSARVMRTHEVLNEVEWKQRNAISRYEEVTRVQNLHANVSPSEQIYHLAHLPELLLFLSVSKDTSPAYSKAFKALEQRAAELVAQIRFNKPVENGGFSVSSIESMKNGEIDSKSIVDPEQHPLDSLMVRTPETVE